MSSCAECIHTELQCPPVIKCKKTDEFRYLDSPICKYFRSLDEVEEEKKE
jgi:hypothetical protein